MKKVMMIITVTLTVLFVVLIIYDKIRMDKTETGMPQGNITVVETPDQSEPMEHEAFVKEEYVSVLPEGENIALDGNIDASSFTDVYVPKKAIDGNTAGPSYWEAEKDSYPNILTLELKDPAKIHAIRLCLCPLNIWGKRTQEFAVRTSMDGTNYGELYPANAYEFSPDRGNEVILEFDEEEAAYVQLEFYSNTGAAGAQIAEFEVYGVYQ